MKKYLTLSLIILCACSKNIVAMNIVDMKEVTLPNQYVLEKRLQEKGYGDFVKTTKIAKQVADKTIHPANLFVIVRETYDSYDKQRYAGIELLPMELLPQEKESGSPKINWGVLYKQIKNIGDKQKSNNIVEIFKIILQDHPEIPEILATPRPGKATQRLLEALQQEEKKQNTVPEFENNTENPDHPVQNEEKTHRLRTIFNCVIESICGKDKKSKKE